MFARRRQTSDNSMKQQPDDIAYPSSIGFVLVHLAMLRRLLDRTDVARPGLGDGALPGPDSRGHRRLPSLLRPSRLPHQPHRPVLPGVRRADLGPAGHPVVGCEPPSAPPALGHGAGRALAGRARIFLRPSRLDLRAAEQHDRLYGGARSRRLPGAYVARSASLLPAALLGVGMADRRLGRAGRRFCWSTVAVWHATFCINSLAHVTVASAM